MKFSEKIDNKFKQCKAENRPAFIAYIAAGDPDFDTSLQVVDRLVSAGVDILELGLPFADPLADGPTNQEAAERALASGMTFTKTFEFAAKIREKYDDIPLILYTYLNPIAHTTNLDDNCKLAAESGIDAMLVLDLPPGEGTDYANTLRDNRMGQVSLVAPTTEDARLEVIGKNATEFIYYVSQVGVTGARSKVASNVGENLTRIKQFTELPIVVGFGISAPEHIAELKSIENLSGIVVGSAIVKRIAAISEGKGSLDELEAFVKSLTSVLK